MNQRMKYLTVSDHSALLPGDSKAMRETRRSLWKCAQRSYPLFIGGETGTGKEYAFRYFSQQLGVPEDRCIAVNCAALEPQLVGAELFGSEKGAFTGAVSRKGLFRAAHKGILFLDEVAELSLSVQAMLLRVIETRRVRPLGSDLEFPVDVRLVSASHQDLFVLAQRGKFRMDLCYRLSVQQVMLPPLRNRFDDLDAIASQLLGRTVQLCPDLDTRLRKHCWPGNLREFRNFLMTQFETETHTSMLTLTALPQPTVRTNILPGISNSMPTLNDFTNRYVHFVYRHFDENLSRTAEALAISRNTVYRHLATTGTHQDRVTLENGRLYFPLEHFGSSTNIRGGDLIPPV